MKNVETKEKPAYESALISMLNDAKSEQKSDDALAVSIRLTALAIYARKEEMSATEIIELLDKEASRFETQAQELH